MKTLALRGARLGLLMAALASAGPAQVLTTTQSLQVTLNPAGIIVSNTNATLTLTGGAFGSYTGSITVYDKIRTSPTGSGSITIQFSTDFAPTNGPRVSNGDLSFTCGTPSYGTGCSGTTTPALTTAYTVNSFGSATCTGGGAPCSSSTPNSLVINFSLPDTTSFRVSSYTTSGLLTISAI